MSIEAKEKSTNFNSPETSRSSVGTLIPLDDLKSGK